MVAAYFSEYLQIQRLVAGQYKSWHLVLLLEASGGDTLDRALNDVEEDKLVGGSLSLLEIGNVGDDLVTHFDCAEVVE